MKNILIFNTVFWVILFLISPLTASAQQSNQQEIEETIRWLNQYGLKFDNGLGYELKRDREVYIIMDQLVYKRTERFVEESEYYDEDDPLKIHKRYINNIIELSVSTDGDKYDVRVYYSGKYDFNGDVKEGRYSEYILFANKDEAIRVFNAFTHLFELYGYDFKAENFLVDENKF